MFLKAEQLDKHLKHSDLANIYIVCGDEPLQKIESIDQIRKTAKTKSYTERIVFDVNSNFDWNDIIVANKNNSLFSEKKIIEINLSSPELGRKGGQALYDYTTQINKDNLVIISSDKVKKATQNTKWFKAVEKLGIVIMVWPINISNLPKWIQTRLKSKQKSISKDAAHMLSQHVEGNLLAAKQEIDMLALLVKEQYIDVEDIMNSITNNSRYNVFDMIESACMGNTDRALYMLTGLKNEGIEPLLIFGAIMWEFRKICSMRYQYEAGVSFDKIYRDFQIRNNKKLTMTSCLKKYNIKMLHKLLNHCAIMDKTLKNNQKNNVWDQFSVLLLGIAGVDTQKLQTKSL